jgi:hypothetical protein
MAKASPITPDEPAAEASAELNYVGDEFWGQGGSYLLDPVTGKRSRIDEPAAVPTQSPEPEELTDATP